MSNDSTPSDKLIKRAYNLGLKIVPNFCSLTEEQIAYYEKNLDKIPEALVRGFIIPPEPEKFALLADLDTITVPKEYGHKTCLADFTKQNQEKFYRYDKNITDKNFPNPSCVLKPGEKLSVTAYKQIVSGTTTSDERLAFLKNQEGNVFVGAQGLTLVFKQKRDKLPKGKWYSSFDEPDRLWKDAVGARRVPSLSACYDGDFGLALGYFGGVWSGRDVVLCFRRLAQKST